MKKFGKLNLENDLSEQLYEDEKVGPVKPGVAMWRLLGRGTPLQLPIPETIVVGPNNYIKILSNDSKGFISQEEFRFENQSNRDEFVSKCVDRFVVQSSRVLDPPEPLYARFVAVQKRAAIKAPRVFITQQSDFLTPIAFQAQALEIADCNMMPGIVQKFVKSRGRRPGVYRLFWKRASNDTGAAEGWNITTMFNEFTAPDMITTQPLPTRSDDDPEEPEAEEIQFKRQTTKFIATYLRSGALQVEGERVKDPLQEQIDKLTSDVQAMTFKPSSTPLARQSMLRHSMLTTNVPEELSPEKVGSPDRTFLTAAPATNAPTNKVPLLRRSMGALRRVDSTLTTADPAAAAAANTNMDFTQFPEGAARAEMTSESYFTQHSPEEIDRLFLKGMTSRLNMSSGDRTKALLINAKANSTYSPFYSTSITTNDGELSEEKCKLLTASRVSSAALETPIRYIALLTHWLEVSLRDIYNLQVFIAEAVADFIKDDNGKWWFINLKSFKLTEDSLPKVKVWHAIYVLRRPASSVIKNRPLSSKERKAKREAEAGVMCALCGVYYMPNSIVQLREEEIDYSLRADPITHMPAFGYQIALQSSRTIATILHKYGVPPTLLTKALLKVNDSEDINARSVKQLLGGDGQNKLVILHKENGGETVVCCYRCFGIFSRSASINERIECLNGLLGICNASMQESSDDAFLRSSNEGKGAGDGMGTTAYASIRPTSASSSTSIAKARAALGGTAGAAKEATLAAKDLLLAKDMKSLTALVKMIKDREGSSSPVGRRLGSPSRHSVPPSTRFCTYHSIPYGVMHWRVLIMFHYAILEDSERLNKAVEAHYFYPQAPVVARDAAQQVVTVPRHFAIHYELGQQVVYAPFLVKHKSLPSKEEVEIDRAKRLKKNKKGKDKGKPGASTDSSPLVEIYKKEQIIPIQECRLHCLCGKPTDVVEYLKGMLVDCQLFSLKDPSSTPAARASFHGGRLSLLERPPQKTMGGKLHEEGKFSLYMNKLKMQKDSQALLEGLEKHDMLLTIPTASLGNVSIKASMAIVRDEVLPQNLSAVDSFLIDKSSIFHPPAAYVPLGLTLPDSWLSMMISAKALAARDEQDESAQKKAKAEEVEKQSRKRSKHNLRGGNGDGSDQSDDEGSDSDSSNASINLDDGQDDLIERMIDRELQKDKAAYEEIVYQRQMAEDREASRQRDLAANSQRLQAEKEKKRWTLVQNTVGTGVSMIRKHSLKAAGSLPTLAELPSAQEETSGAGLQTAARKGIKRHGTPPPTPPPAAANIATQPSAVVKPSAALKLSAVSKPAATSVPATSAPPLSKPSHAPRSEGATGEKKEETAEEKQQKRNRVMNQLAQFLRKKAHEEHGAASGALTPATAAPVSSVHSAEQAALETNARARRNRAFSAVSNNLLKFTAFQSQYSPALQAHFEGIEAFLRLFEERMLELELNRSHASLGDDQANLMEEMMAEHGLDSKLVLGELSAVVYSVQEEFEEYNQLMQEHLASQPAASSDSPPPGADGTASVTSSSAGGTSVEGGSGIEGSPRSTEIQGSRKPALSFFTVARVMVKHTNVQQTIQERGEADEDGEEEEEGASTLRARGATMMAAVGRRSSIRDMIMTRGSSGRKNSAATDLRAAAAALEMAKRRKAHGTVCANRMSDGVLTDTEIYFLSTSLIDAMTLALRQLTVMEYLPETITWVMLKPLIMESLPTFLMER